MGSGLSLGSGAGLVGAGQELAGAATGGGSAGSIIGGLQGANTVGNTVSNALGNGPLTSSLVGAGLGAAGAGLGLYNAAQDPSNPANDINAGKDAYNLWNTGSQLVNGLSGISGSGIGAGTGLFDAGAAATGEVGGGAAGASIAANAAATGEAATGASTGLEAAAGSAVGGAALAGLGYILSTAIFGGTPATDPSAIARVGPGQSVGVLSSGGQVLEQGNLGFGVGTQETKGADQWYQIGPNGQQTWLGQTDSTQLQQGLQDYSKTLTSGNGTLGSAAAIAAAKGQAAGQGAGTAASHLASNLQSTSAEYLAQIQGVYDSTGGQKTWGTDFNSFLNNALGIENNVKFA